MRCVCALFSCQKTPPFWNYSLFFLLWAISVNSLLSLQPNTHTQNLLHIHTLRQFNYWHSQWRDFFVRLSLTFKAARELGCGAFFAACFLILFAVFILKYKTKKNKWKSRLLFSTRDATLDDDTSLSHGFYFFSLSLDWTGLYTALTSSQPCTYTHTRKRIDVTSLMLIKNAYQYIPASSRIKCAFSRK